MVIIYNVNDGIEEAIWPVAKLFYQSNIDTRWVSQDEGTSVYLSNYLAQYHPNPGYQNKNIHKYRYPSAIKKCIILIKCTWVLSKKGDISSILVHTLTVF